MLVAILNSPASPSPMSSHSEIDVLAGAGLAGDRYATGRGFYSGMVEWDAHVTLIEQEPLDRLADEHGVVLDPKELRRNLVTRGIDLGTLIGRRFRIGDRVVLRGRKPWPPCAHIVSLSGRSEIFRYLARQTGIGADVLESGPIRLGDPIAILGDDPGR